MNTRTRAIDAQLTAGVAVFRAAAWAWLAVVAAVSTNRMDRPVLGWVVVGLTGALTAWLGVQAIGRRAPRPRSSAAALVPVVLDVIGAVALLVADGWVYEAGRPQSLAGAWPVAAVLAVAIVGGRWWSLATALLFGAARVAGQIGLVGAPAGWPSGNWLSVLSSTVLFALAGLAAAEVARRVRQAEDELADARARERVARDLHDGMLQTLAAVQRRAQDTDLVALARAQESELRAYLFEPAGPGGVTAADGGPGGHRGDVDATLRWAAAGATRRWGLAVDLALVPPLPRLDPVVAEALGGAVGEGLANIAKHAGVDRANLYAEATPAGLVVVVRDRGCGFDPETTTQRGLAHSIIDRVHEVGGTVDLHSTPGSGTELTLHLPTRDGANR